MLTKSTLFTTALMIILGFTACSRPAEESPDRTYPYRIVATTGMIADILRQVAGSHAEVENLIGEGLDPHLYQPNRTDVLKLGQADIVFYHGLLLEGRMSEVLQRQKRQDRPVHAVADLIRERNTYPLATDEGALDPHIWMDVTGWMEAVRVVASVLAAFDPPHAGDYSRNASAYLQQLEALNDYARTVLDTIPTSQRILVTAHDAFSYLGRAYGLEVRGIQGLSTSSEAGIRDIEALVELIVSRKIPAIFVESSVSDKNVRALIEGARARGHRVRIGGTLFSDAMGPAGTYEGTYMGMIDHNVTTIAHALGGDTPPRGMNARLSRTFTTPSPARASDNP